eukprot:gene4627-3332_t
MDSEAQALRRSMAEAAAERHDLLAATYAASGLVQAASAKGAAMTETLAHSLEHLHAKATALTDRGALWRHERQQCQHAVAHHIQLLQLLEAPQLLEDAVQQEMYTEAITVLQHIRRASLEAAPPRPPEEAPGGANPLPVAEADSPPAGTALLAGLRRRAEAALERSLRDVILPRLAGPLTVDGAFRALQFLRLVAAPAQQSVLPSLFLAARTTYTRHLREEAAGFASPAQRLKRYLQLYKVALQETVLQFAACFAEDTEGLLHDWCSEQSNALQDAMAADVAQLTNSYELGVLWEQGFAASLSAGKAFCSIWPVLSALVVDRAMELFCQHMRRAERAYQERVRHFSWTASAAAAPPLLRAGAAATTGWGRGASAALSGSGGGSFSESFTPANSFTATLGGLTGSAAVELMPPMELADFAPLAHALNGFLHAMNSVHRVLLPGMEQLCVEETTALLRLIASDLARDSDALAGDADSLRVYASMVQAFGGLLYPHVLRCVATAFGDDARHRLELALAAPMARLERVSRSAEALQSPAVTAAAAVPPDPPSSSGSLLPSSSMPPKRVLYDAPALFRPLATLKLCFYPIYFASIQFTFPFTVPMADVQTAADGTTVAVPGSHYVEASKLYTANQEIAYRYGIAALQETAATYYAAKLEHKAANERFGCRGPIPVPERLEERYEIDTYTSSTTGTLKQYEVLPPKPDLREVQRELLVRAEERRRGDLAEAAKKAAAAKTATGFVTKRRPSMLELLEQRCDNEYVDILELEAEDFKRLARIYFDNLMGDIRMFAFVEARARRMLEDIEHTIAMGLLGQLREQIFGSEELLMVRAMGYYPYPPSLRNHRRTDLEEAPAVLDVMYAAPLWERVTAVRRETEMEESILFLRLHLAHCVQRDLVEKDYIRLRGAGPQKRLQYNAASEPPSFMHDTIRFGFATEKLCIEVDEETDRMRIADASLEERAALFAAMRAEEEELIGWLVDKYGSRKGQDKIKRMFAFMHDGKGVQMAACSTPVCLFQKQFISNITKRNNTNSGRDNPFNLLLLTVAAADPSSSSSVYRTTCGSAILYELASSYRLLPHAIKSHAPAELLFVLAFVNQKGVPLVAEVLGLPSVPCSLNIIIFIFLFTMRRRLSPPLHPFTSLHATTSAFYSPSPPPLPTHQARWGGGLSQFVCPDITTVVPYVGKRSGAAGSHTHRRTHSCRAITFPFLFLLLLLFAVTQKGAVVPLAYPCKPFGRSERRCEYFYSFFPLLPFPPRFPLKELSVVLEFSLPHTQQKNRVGSFALLSLEFGPLKQSNLTNQRTHPCGTCRFLSSDLLYPLLSDFSCRAWRLTDPSTFFLFVFSCPIMRTSPSQRGQPPAGALVPPIAKRGVLHRNPNHVARDALDAHERRNPLMSRLYSDGLTSGEGLGVPNRLAQQSSDISPHPPTCDSVSDSFRATYPSSVAMMGSLNTTSMRTNQFSHTGESATTASKEDTTDTKKRRRDSNSNSSLTAMRGKTKYIKSLQVFHQPKFSDKALHKLFTESATRKEVPIAVRRQRKRPSQLAPLQGPSVDEDGAEAPASARAAGHGVMRIPHFVKATSNSPNEFTYMLMRPRGIRDPFNPYDLQVVTHKELKTAETYYTVSSAGVTQFTGGPAEFIQLPTWEREFRIFHQIRELPVFSEYKRWRSFLIWRGLVRKHAINNSREYLTKNLFHVHPNLSGALQAVRRICLEYASSSLYAAPTECRTLDSYCTYLDETLSTGRQRLEGMMRIIRDHVESACKVAMLTAQQEREKMKVLHDDDDRKKKKVVDIRELGTQQQPSYIEMTQRKATCKRLTAFIKLCDYMVVTCLTTLAAKAVENVRDDFLYPFQLPKKYTPLPVEKGKKPEAPYTGPPFNLEIVYNTDEHRVEVVPNLPQVAEAMEDIVRDYIRTVGSVPRLVSMDAFKVYVDNAEDEMGGGPDVAEMVVSEEDYKQNMATLRESISSAFADIEKYVRSFDVYRDMYVSNSKFDPDALLQQPQTLDFFRERLTMYKAQMESISTKIPNFKDVGLATVQTQGLREFFTPSPVECLQGFHRVLPIIAHRHNEALLEELQRHNTYLAAHPKTIEQYVEYVSYYKDLETNFDNISASYDFIRELFSLLQEEKIEVSEEEEEIYRSGTRPQFDKLRTVMQIIEDGREAQQRLFTRTIDEEMESLRHRIEKAYDKAGQPIVMTGDAPVEEVIAYITELQKETECIAAREKELRGFQLQIGAEETTVDMVDMINDVNIKTKLWVGVRDWDLFTEEMRAIPFEKLDISSLQDTVIKYNTLVKQVSSKLSGNAAVPQLRDKVEEWRQLMPILQALTNPKMKLEHHIKVSNVVGPIEDANGTSKTLSEWSNQFTTAMLLENDVLRFRDAILAISVAATEEDKLQQQIDKVNAMWNGGGPKPPMEFQFLNHKELKDTYVLVGSSVEDVSALLDDSMISISTIGSSKYCQGVLRAQVDRWENRLRYMQETLDKWVELQRNWIYLENIFSSSEIRSQWKDDAKRFEKADRFFRDVMRKAHDLPTAFRGLLINPPSFDPNEPTTGKTLQQDLTHYIKELEKVLASLERKLEEKRCAFPRFYFLSNDDLLDILAKVKTPELMMPHMLKMFDGIKSLTFTEQNDITHLLSMEGEQVELINKNVKARGAVEGWLDMLEREMFFTLRKLAQACLEDYEERQNRSAWMFQHAVQLVLIMEQLLWTRGVEESLDQPDSEALMSDLKESGYKSLEELAGLTSQQLSKVQRILLSTLITIDVHGRDLIDEMVENNVVESKEFGWTKQLRAYWEKDEDGHGNIFIRQNNSRFVYGYEYLGAQGRLVITPLTDRIYMTVTGALKLYLGASPAGPAGTGKTETVKDLAKNLARQCIVYNCSDGVTYKMMEKFFSGLIQTGAWACLDEFNRINIEVLSVIASQLLEIKLALQNGKESFTFQGAPNVRVRATYGAFVTMNPGYAGRTELPDNLKILFRPVAVMTPDFRMIAEVILYSEGFTNAKDLSLKITQLYKLSSEQLSPQDHYDFGMRALKSILVMAGDLKRSQPDVEEDLTLIVACNDSNVPKFVSEDIPLFQGIMQDLFPGVSFPEREYEELLPAMHKAMDTRKLMDEGIWVKKGIQFYETLIVRHGVMLVGVTGTGKTETRNCISTSLESMGAAGSSNHMAKPVHQFIMNPKSILMHELYGTLDVNTNEWKDGVLACLAKQCVRDSELNKDHRWLVFDGPVDTLWIESLNSVLDDSKLLCLDSGERIKLPDTMHLLFEVADLAVASPATVSRCGMVYVDADDLPWTAVVGKWTETKLAGAGAGPQCRAYVKNLFLTYVPKGLEWLSQQRVLINAGEINVIESMCELFSALITVNNVAFQPDPDGETVIPPEDPIFRTRNETCNILFAFSFFWSIGGNVDQSTMESFDTMARTVLETVLRIPNHGFVYDFMIDFNTRMLIPWESKLSDFVYDEKTPFFDILVPTVDTVRYSYIAKTLIQCGRPILFNGQTGVGKSVIMADTLFSNKEEMNLAIISFQFSAQTSSERTQELIETKLKQKRKNILGAPPGKNVVLFIDDLNMPALEVFGASPPIELLRQLMGNGGFYDRKIAGFWKFVQDVTVVAACGPPEGGRNPVTARLTRLFHLLQIPNLTDDSMRRIFGSILKGFLEHKNFSKDVKDMTKHIVNATVDVFNKIRDGLRPRPTTPHYTFNLRDVAKVFQGLLQVIPRVCRDQKAFTRLWVHESMRCFYDRLATAEDRQFFTEEVVMEALSRVPGSHSHEEYFERDPIVWGDFFRFGSSERVYEESTDFKRIPQILDEYQDDYNNTISTSKGEDDTVLPPLNLVFFTDHCEHLARIIRIVRQPRGNALLVGVGGSGKRSLTRLASYVANSRVFEISVGKGYSMTDFHEFLLELYTCAGVKCTPSVFMISDNQIVHEAMLEDVNNMLNSGEVPSLFTPEEREKRVNACLEAAQQAGINNRDDVYNFFISRVRDNMHIALCMSPVGDTFRTRCRQFPSLTNCCAIDWFDEWPNEALRSVAERLLTDIKPIMPEELMSKLPSLCVDVHSTITDMSQAYWDELRRRYYVTPTSYLEFIETYKAIFNERRSVLAENLEQVQNGVDKMKETDEMIAKMKIEIETKRPLLEKASKETEEVVADLKVRQAAAGEVQVQVRAQEEAASEQKKVASLIAAEAQGELDKAKPILDDAQAALKTISNSDINELRSFTIPPPAVRLCAQSCMAMFDHRDPRFSGWSGSTEWKGCKEFLSTSNLLKYIETYDAENIPPSIIKKMIVFVENPEFTPAWCETKGSKTAASLCRWVHAMYKYSEVIKKVGPLREAAAKAAKDLEETSAKLNAAQKKQMEVEQELMELEKNYEKSIKKKNDLEAGLRTCITRLENAETLSECLKSEGTRWAENIKILNKRLEELPLQSFLASACAAYFGAFTPLFRKRLMARWTEKIMEEGLDVSGVNGLPTDETSTENAIIATMSYAPRRWPLFIDPQEQGVKWLTQQYGPVVGTTGKMKVGLKIIKLTESTWMRTLEAQIRLGGTVIIDDVGETLDPALEPLISRRITETMSGKQIQLTPQSGPVDYHPSFRMFICTKLPNPLYLPDISTRLTLLNFTVTLDGLEDQMLGEVVSIEKREMEEEKNKIIQSIAQGQKKLKQIEAQILSRLKNTKGNILDDSELISELKSAQANAEILKANEAEAQEKMSVISASREGYREVAVRAAVLFFVLADIARIDPMYQYSLQFFVKMVQLEIKSTPKDEDYSDEIPEMLLDHLHTVVDGLTLTFYKQICRGLFNKDKNILSLLVSSSIARQQKTILEEEWQYFVRATALVASDLAAQPPDLAWFSRVQYEVAEALERTVPAFKGMHQSIRANTAEWKAWIQADDPHRLDVPCGWHERLSPFQRILLIRCFREEKLFFALGDYVIQTMGQEFMEPPPFDLERALRDTTPTVPIIFILSQGADPMGALQTFAGQENQDLQYVSLGQGQGENAKRLIAQCRKSGAWAMLQNCHLSKSFMPDLELQVAALQAPQIEINPTFRLWLTSMPVDFFPIFVLQTSIKITNEPPTGLKANMIRCFNDLTNEEYEAFPDTTLIANYDTDVPKGLAFKKLLYGLCFFHSIVLERKKFGPLGWNVRYEWNDTDFHVSKQWLRLFFEEQGSIPWESLEYIIGQINYGGRVTDPQDRGTLQTILRNYLCTSILDDDFKFSDSGKYFAPPVCSLDDAKNHISEMSLIDDPEVFGMHENASLRYQQQSSHYVLSTVVSIQPRLVGSNTGDGPTPEEEVQRKCREFEATLPSVISRDEAGLHTFTTLANGLPNSMSTVLSHELVKYNKLIQRMIQTLSDMQKALQGLTVLSSDLDAMYSSFLSDQVPQLWSSVSYASLKPLGAWYREFLEKVKFIRTWVQKGEPKAFWMAGFFNPSAFMTGVYQAFARAEAVSVDKLGFKYTVLNEDLDDITARPERGCYVYGIFTDAWRWDAERRVMTDSLPGEPYDQLPVVHFLPEPYHKKPDDFHAVPMYRTTVRAGVISSLGASSNYVLSVEMPSANGSDFWLLKGAACVCALEIFLVALLNFIYLLYYLFYFYIFH